MAPCPPPPHKETHAFTSYCYGPPSLAPLLPRTEVQPQLNMGSVYYSREAIFKGLKYLLKLR